MSSTLIQLQHPKQSKNRATQIFKEISNDWNISKFKNIKLKKFNWEIQRVKQKNAS